MLNPPKLRSLILPLAISLGLSGCGHVRQPQSPGMAVPATRLIATPFAASPAPQSAPSAQLSVQSDFAREILTTPAGALKNCSALATVHAYTPIADASHYVVLSGGGPHGAFGAGFFLGLQEKGLLPAEPAVVTGVSTGSLQSTFVFLARQAVPADRKPYSWADGMAVARGDLKPGQSNLEDLAVAYSIAREGDILKPSFTFLGVALPLGGSVGTLAPLHDRLLKLITPQTIEAIAVEACRGRKLYVGAVSVDDGNAYAFNLTALALGVYDNGYPAAQNRMTMARESYVNALLASSSVPIGALPVQLRIRDVDPGTIGHRTNLFIDGGARNGVFFSGANEARHNVPGMAKGGETDISLVVNTVLGKGPWSLDNGNVKNPSTRWKLIPLITRSVDILTDQAYQTSVADVTDKADKLRVALLDGWHLPGQNPDDHEYAGQTCAQWHDADAKAKPIEFYPQYMACLIDYGRERGRKGLWNKQDQ